MVHEVSDIHIKVGRPPIFRKEGRLIRRKDVDDVDDALANQWFDALASPEVKAIFEEKLEVDFAYAYMQRARFRINAFRQLGHMGLVFRQIPAHVRSTEALRLPPVIKDLASLRRGLVLVTGATGSGKSTTLAAMIHHINTTRACHILTIEDPVEFTFTDQAAIVNQREIGRDTRSFSGALRAALRQDPDVILLGELRDLETIETALHAAETGHLVLSTLHTVDAMESINRIIGVFPPHQQGQVRLQLSTILRGVISQRLIPSPNGSRVPCCEVMVANPFIRQLIAEPERTVEIPIAIKAGGSNYGMQTFDMALHQLWQGGHITRDAAIAHATNPADLKLKFEGIGTGQY